MTAYLRLEVVRALRSGAYLTYTILFPAAFYLLFTLIMQAGPMDDGTDYDAYFMVSMALYGSIGAGLTSVGGRIALERTRGWTRQLALSPLRSRDYVMVKVLTAAALSVPVIALIMLAGWLVNGVSLPWHTWLALVPALVAGGLPFAALGIAIGYTFRDEVAQMASLGAYFILSMAGGLWMPTMVFPDWLQTISRALPTHQAGQLSWRLLAGDQPFGAGAAVLLAWTVAFAVLAAWRYRRAA